MNYIIKDIEESDDLKDIVDSVSTGSKSPEEVLDNLDTIGIESYVTEKGDLMIKVWQVGAEKFVTPEHASVIRSNRPILDKVNNLDWLSLNMEKVRKNFSDKWIAVYDKEVVNSAKNLPDLLNQIEQFDEPLVTFIPKEPVVWTFAYAL